MQKSDIKDNLNRSGFVFTDLDGGGRITAHGPKVPGPIGEKTTVRVQKGGETLHTSTHASNGAAASTYVQLVEEYSDT